MDNKTMSREKSVCICQQLEDRINQIQEYLENKFSKQNMDKQAKEMIIQLQEKRILEMELMISKLMLTLGDIKSGIKSPQLDQLNDEMLKLLRKSILSITE